MYFPKKSYALYNHHRNHQCGLGRSWGIVENFCVKSDLAVCKVTFHCKLYRKNWGSRMY